MNACHSNILGYDPLSPVEGTPFGGYIQTVDHRVISQTIKRIFNNTHPTQRLYTPPAHWERLRSNNNIAWIAIPTALLSAAFLTKRLSSRDK